jgi:competence protein ComEA
MLRLTRILTLLVAMMVASFVFAGTVDLNSADAESIAANLDGIGMAKAQAIVAYREQHGAFNSLDDLLQVKGIGAKTLDRNRDMITLETSSKHK